MMNSEGECPHCHGHNLYVIVEVTFSCPARGFGEAGSVDYDLNSLETRQRHEEVKRFGCEDCNREGFEPRLI